MRLYRISREDVATTIASPATLAYDQCGNERLGGITADGRPILVVVAGDAPDRDNRLHSTPMMRADYDSAANAITISLVDAPHAEVGDEVGDRAVVALAGGRPVEIQVLYPEMGIDVPLADIAERYELDREALYAAARSALAAPDRVVTLEVDARAAA